MTQTNELENLLDEVSAPTAPVEDTKQAPVEEPEKVSKETPGLEQLFSEQALAELQNKAALKKLDLNELKLGDLLALLAEDVLPENWSQDEGGVLVTKFAIDDWSELNSFNDFFKTNNDIELSVAFKEGIEIFLATKEQAKAQAFNKLFDSIVQQEESNTKVQEKEQSEPTPEAVTKEKQTFRQPTQQAETVKSGPVTKGSIHCFSQNNTYFAQIPIAKKGTWEHPIYGTVSYGDNELQQIKANIENNVLGWEPPLFYGHPEDGGAPSEGFLVDVVLISDTLFGIWEVNEAAYEQIQSGRYRYSSSEFFHNYQSKENGEVLGTVLIGMALTNRPFIPDLPRNVALAEDANEGQEKIKFEMEIGYEANPPEDTTSFDQPQSSNQTMSQEQPQSQEQLDSLQSELNSTKELLQKYSDELNAVKESYQQQISDLKEQNEALAARIRQEELDKKLSKLEQFNIPQGSKDRYKQLFSEGKLGAENENEIMSSLEEMSSSLGAEKFTQHSESASTQSMNEENTNPGAKSLHSDAIEQMRQQAEERKRRRQERAQRNFR